MPLPAVTCPSAETCQVIVHASSSWIPTLVTGVCALASALSAQCLAHIFNKKRENRQDLKERLERVGIILDALSFGCSNLLRASFSHGFDSDEVLIACKKGFDTHVDAQRSLQELRMRLPRDSAPVQKAEETTSEAYELFWNAHLARGGEFPTGYSFEEAAHKVEKFDQDYRVLAGELLRLKKRRWW
jgi:hypothetical protein